MTMAKKNYMLIILDGWGLRDDRRANAILQANTPFMDDLLKRYAHTRLLCSGEAVGLPAGVMGNSEVGHMNIGAGRIVYQDLMRINAAIENGEFAQNPEFTRLMDRLAASGRNLHLLGLLSDGGVHSHIEHLKALVNLARGRGVPQTLVHAILDGRDTPPHSAADYIRQLQAHLESIGYGRIASLCGRFYAMDRDTRWQRVEAAYRLYTHGQGVSENDPLAAVQKAYARQETDEFVKPIVIEPAALVQNGDGIICFNFRADRVREITRAFTETGFDRFDTGPRPELAGYVCMTRYDEDFDLPVAFGPVHLEKILGEQVSAAGLHQLRIAETEKYAHVTYFFNGGEEAPFPNEDRCLIPSPRDIPTYDYKPQMSAPLVTEEVLKRLQSGKYDLVVLNFANGDMVGHTGILKAAVKACETVDHCLSQIVDRVLSRGGSVIITADHGNAETMADAEGNPYTSHTLNPVPLILVDDARSNVRLREGILGDIAPTLLEIMGLDQPPQMTGESLILH